MKRFGSFMLLLSILFLHGCDGGDILRKVELDGGQDLPAGEISSKADVLSLSVPDLERLNDGSQYVAWAVTQGGAVALGKVSPGESFSFDLSNMDLAFDDILEIEVTEEDSGESPPSRSANKRMHGSAEGSLDYSALSKSDLVAVSGSIEINNGYIGVETNSLPPLSEGLFYGVWGKVGGHDDGGGHGQALVLLKQQSAQEHPADEGADENHDDDGHADDEEAADDDHDEATFVFIGALGADGALHEEAEVDLTNLSEIRITVESVRGAEEMSPIVVLKGEVVLPGIETEKQGHAH